MTNDPALLVFIAGALAGAAVVLLGRLVPDVILSILHIAAYRRTQAAPHRLP